MYVTMPHMSDSVENKRFLPNALAIAGFIVLTIIIVWGLLHLASLSGGWFSSLFEKKADTTISVSAPASVVSGTPMTLTWKYSPKDKGSYALLYQCDTGVQFAAPSNQSFTVVPCGAAFTLGNATSSVILLPVSNATSSVKVPLTVLFIPSATGAQAQGSTNITITPGTKSVVEIPAPVVSKPTPKPTPVTGPADLAITIVASNVDQFGNGTVTFDIANIGGSSSGTYYFSVQLPTSQPYSYNSPAQASLAPQSHITSTLTFSQAVGGTFSVSVSGGNDVNNGNNYASQYINAPAYYPNQYQQYPQYQYGY
jgi:hypothetical protein